MEFVLVGTLLTVLFLSLVQLGLALYVRNVAVSEATEAARYAANADRSCDQAVEWLRDQLSAALPSDLAGEPTCAAPGTGVVETTVTVRVPVFGLAGTLTEFVVRGHALDEHVR